MNVNPEVDAWFDDRRPVQAEVMQKVREVILGADDRITETIKWKTPTFMYQGNIASFNPAKKFTSLLFHRGGEIQGNDPEPKGKGPLRRGHAVCRPRRGRSPASRARSGGPRLVCDEGRCLSRVLAP